MDFYEVDFEDMVDFIYSMMTLSGLVISRETVIAVLDAETQYILELGMMGEEE